MKAKILLAAKKFASRLYYNRPYHIWFRGTIGEWTYFAIKMKGMPRYTGFGTLIRVYRNGKVDRDTYFLPPFMWTRAVPDTPLIREAMASYIKEEKKDKRERDEFLQSHPNLRR